MYLLNCSITTNLNIQPALITAGVAVFIFLIGRIIDGQLKKRERILTWYFKTVIDPNLSKIDDALDEIQKAFSKSRKNLIEEAGNDDFLLIKTKIFGEYDDFIRNLSIELFSLVRISHPKIYTELDTIMNDFDSFKRLLDSDLTLSSEDSESTFKRDLYVLKGRIYEILFKPISKSMFDIDDKEDDF